MPSTVPGTTANESAKEIKEKDARTPLLNELIKTERDFVQSLEQLYEYQMELLSIRTLSFDIGTTLFANLSELIEFQRGFLDEMEVELGLGPGNQRIGGLFLRHEAAFQVYYPFCRNYQNAINVILMEGEQLRALEHIIASQQLQSYLIKPLQRLMRYPMLLKELIKLTDPNTYPYMEELNKAADAVKKITETLNELQRKDENARIKIDFLERLEDSKDLKTNDLGTSFVSWPRAKGSSGGLRSPGRIHTFTLRGNIEIKSIIKVEDTSDSKSGSYSIKVHWQDSTEPEPVKFSLICLNGEQVKLWKDRINKQVEYQKSIPPVPLRRKNSENLFYASSRSFSNPHNQSAFFNDGYGQRNDIPQIPQIPPQFQARARGYSHSSAAVSPNSPYSPQGMGSPNGTPSMPPMRRESGASGFNSKLPIPNATVYNVPIPSVSASGQPPTILVTTEPRRIDNTSTPGFDAFQQLQQAVPATLATATTPASSIYLWILVLCQNPCTHRKHCSCCGDAIKEASLLELHARIDRKMAMQRLGYQFTEMTAKEEVDGEWILVRELVTDKDVVAAIAQSNGTINVFLS
ncbi:Dbl homology domain-containing protein [Rhizoclosmatium globosum]|uniref:Dbl homology domain-containing protein n=1 Tax=Rhizoclosmatium globosum TaxID=329046 RepID=A0A1Y2BZN2_9FUNG|nr:Dbl homology domain-containing protein [Rhizoclosmatium globosum]|eukprot:ORY40087.1 Dbl homology domain-containing protein [Rhizoclosmatium globosum]